MCYIYKKCLIVSLLFFRAGFNLLPPLPPVVPNFAPIPLPACWSFFGFLQYLFFFLLLSRYKHISPSNPLFLFLLLFTLFVHAPSMPCPYIPCDDDSQDAVMSRSQLYISAFFSFPFFLLLLVNVFQLNNDLFCVLRDFLFSA